jgi:CRISPR/Cas system-associated protein Cas5 (RAMP superfamily)
MRKNAKIFWVFFLFVFFSSCSLLPKGESSKDPRTKGEKEFDPLGFEEDRVIITEGDYGIIKEDPTGIKNRRRETEAGGLEEIESFLPEKIYRVQFFATKYPDEARQVADFVKSQLFEKTYIDFKVPYYWIRVGDCETKEEANSLLEKIKRLGYSESWVVEIKVKQD